MAVSTLPENRYFEGLREAYRKKYAAQPIDLIIAVNYRALNFLISPSGNLFNLKAHVDGRTFISGVRSTTDQASIFSSVSTSMQATSQYNLANG